jgi:hypothetical protein
MLPYYALFAIVEIVEVIIVSALWLLFGILLKPIKTKRKQLAYLVTKTALQKEYKEMNAYLKTLNKYTILTFVFAFAFMIVGLLILNVGLYVIVAASTLTGLLAGLVDIAYIGLFLFGMALFSKAIKHFSINKYTIGV